MVRVRNLLEWVTLSSFLHSLHNSFVDTEKDGARQCQQGCVGNYTDEREVCEGQEDDEDASEDGPRFFGVSPVD